MMKINSICKKLPSISKEIEKVKRMKENIYKGYEKGDYIEKKP